MKRQRVLLPAKQNSALDKLTDCERASGEDFILAELIRSMVIEYTFGRGERARNSAIHLNR